MIEPVETIVDHPELLAPAGDWDAMRAACANGANAVYFGLSAFNARHRATNFTVEELPRVIEFLHARNVRGFVTLNTLIFSDELESLADYVRQIASAGADAVIVQDVGVARLIGQIAPDLHVHASTQMTLTEPRGVEWARDRLGIRRAVLARELSVADIQKVASGSTVPLEVFVHGALCVAYSGQCLTSEALGGRSANRGQCAQACRLPYELVSDGKTQDLGDRAYLLSPQDLAGHEIVGELVDAGVISFKIEGRLKGPHYVAATTKAYRDAIDAAVEKRSFRLPDEQRRELQQTYSRGFTPGFLKGADHQTLVGGRFPKSRGIQLGTVRSAGRHGIRIGLIDSDTTIVPGDGVVFDLGKPEDKEPGGRVWEVRTNGPAVVELVFESGAIDPRSIPVGTIVWKTDDPAMRKRLEQTYTGDPIALREPIRLELSGEIGGAVQLRAVDERGRSASADWPGPLELARKKAMDQSEVRQQLDRLGDTPFKLGELTSTLPQNAMLPKSVLNDLRRTAVAKLLQVREAGSRIAVVEPNALQQWRTKIDAKRDGTPRQSPVMSVMARTVEQVQAVLPHHPAMVYCDFEDVRRYRDAVPLANAAGVPIALATLRILKPGEEGFLKSIVQAGPDAILVRNLGSLLYFREHAPEIELIGDFSLNVANELTADLLMGEGLSRLVPSFDLNWDQFTSLIRRANPAWFEPVIHQHMPMFHMEHCVFAAFLSKGKDWRDCGRPCDRHRIELRDRVGSEFPVLPDAGCRNTVFNSVPQSAAEYLAKMKELGLRRFRVDLLRETPEEAVKLLQHYRLVIEGREDGKESWKQLQALNQLGVTRGTLNLV